MVSFGQCDQVPFKMEGEIRYKFVTKFWGPARFWLLQAENIVFVVFFGYEISHNNLFNSLQMPISL